MNRKSNAISKKTALLIIVSIIGVILIIILGAVISGNALLDSEMQAMLYKTELEALKTDSWLQGLVLYVNSVAKSVNVSEYASDEELAEFLDLHRAKIPEFLYVYMGMPDGRLVLKDYPTPPGFDSTQRGWYTGAAAKAPDSEIVLYPDAASGDLMMALSTAVIDVQSGALKGVIAADVEATTLQNIVHEAGRLEGGYAFLIDQNGDFLIHPNQAYQPVGDAFKNITAVDGGVFSGLYNEKHRNNKPVNLRGPDGISRYYAAHDIPSAGWRLYITIPESIVYAPVYNFIFILIPVSLILIAALVFISLRTIKFVGKVLGGAVSELQNFAEDITGTVSEVSRNAGSLSESSSDESASIQETASAIEQMSGIAEKNMRNTLETLKLTNETSEEVQDGALKITNLINYMAELDQSSREISNVINMISSIASQTNILALNASVESARAGESGKAFAVVAEEVRSLAQKSNDAVKSTSAIIANNVRITQQSIENSREVSKSFDTIAGKIEKANQIVGEITTASEEQSKSVQHINQTLGKMETIMQSNVSISRQSADSADKLKSQSDILYELTDNIKSLV